jgi:hypothetical protein
MRPMRFPTLLCSPSRTAHPRKASPRSIFLGSPGPRNAPPFAHFSTTSNPQLPINRAKKLSRQPALSQISSPPRSMVMAGTRYFTGSRAFTQSSSVSARFMCNAQLTPCRAHHVFATGSSRHAHSRTRKNSTCYSQFPGNRNSLPNCVFTMYRMGY